MDNDNIVIIIAEDEDDIRDIYVTVFTRAGFDVLEARNGKEAMEWLSRKGKEIDVIVSDIIMPKMDGFELLEKMRDSEEYKKIPVIVTTNLDNDNDRRTAFGLGASEYFEKVKWDPIALAKKVKEIAVAHTSVTSGKISGAARKV